MVLDELNAALKPHDLRFAPGRVVGQPRHRRRHDGQQLERRAVGPLRQDDRSRARAARGAGRRPRSRTFGRSIAAALEAATAGDSIEARAYRAVPAARRAPRRRDRAPLSEGAAPRRRLQPRRVRRSGRAGRSDAASWSAPRARSASSSRPRSGWCRCRGRRRVLTVEFDELLDALGATPLILRHGPSAVEVMDDFILPHAQEPRRARRAAARDDRASTARRCCASSSTPTTPTSCRRGSRRSSAIWRRRGRAQTRQVIDAAAQAGDLELPRGRARAVDGDARRRQGDLVRRGHGGRARAAARLHRALPRSIVARHGTDAGVYAHASVGCLHVGRSST